MRIMDFVAVLGNGITPVPGVVDSYPGVLSAWRVSTVTDGAEEACGRRAARGILAHCSDSSVVTRNRFDLPSGGWSESAVLPFARLFFQRSDAA